MSIEIILNDGTYYTPTDDDINYWAKLYPKVDVEKELRAMAGWSDSKPKNRKTKRGVKAFVTNWLNRAQDKGGSNLPEKRSSMRDMEMNDMLTDISWVEERMKDGLKRHFLAKYGQYYKDGVRYYE